MLVDPIGNPFDAAFAPWPLRFYILQGGLIRYKAQVWWAVLHCPASFHAAADHALARSRRRPPPTVRRPPARLRPSPCAPQPSNCSYDLSELRSRLLELLAAEGGGGAAGQEQPPTGE